MAGKKKTPKKADATETPEPPLEAPPRRVTVNGRVVPFSGEELVIRHLPAEVLFER